METFGDFFILAIKQFSGGPGPAENNLVRFGLASAFWLVLLVIAWTRQKSQHLPREKLLIWGFGLALTRELMMFGLTVWQITGGGEDIYYHPLEHGLEVAALIVVAGAFLRYALDDESISRRYLQVGLSIIVMVFLITYITWPTFSNLNPGAKFSETWESRVFHIFSFVLITAAIFVLAKKRDWLRSVVSVALSFFLISEIMRLASYATHQTYNYFLCPISNTFHILAIPIFGFVYLKEMSLEKKKTEEELDDYRDHLEDLVDERTGMLVAQNEIADSLSQSLDLKTVLDLALDKMLPVLSMDVGVIFLIDQKSHNLLLGAYRGSLSQEDLDLCAADKCPYRFIAQQAVDNRLVISQPLDDKAAHGSIHLDKEVICTLMGAPLIAKGEIVGAIALGSQQVEPLDQTILDLLDGMCNQVGMAVENAYLYQEAEKWAEKLSTLHQAGIKLGSTLDVDQIIKEIIDQSIKLTGRKAACLLSWNKKKGVLSWIASEGFNLDMKATMAISPNDGHLFDALWRTKTSIVVENITQDKRIPRHWQEGLGNRSLLCTRVWKRGKKSINLFILDESEGKPWRSKDIELVESFVSHTSVALENAYLHKQLEWAATLEERQRIAANMHDGLAQTISLLGLKIDQVTQLFPSDKNGGGIEALEEIRKTVDIASLDVRKSIASLQKIPEPRKTLQELLVALAEEASEENTILFDTSFSFPAPLVLPPAQVAQLTPIIQEAIVNIRKHAQATKVHISGEQLDEKVIIKVEDNGIGFDTTHVQAQNGNHFGIKLMNARATRLGAHLEFASEPGLGTRVQLSWMLDEDPDYLALDGFVYMPEIFMEGDNYV